MSSRDFQIPLALWICAALVAHFVGGGGAVVGTKVAEQVAAERASILELVHGVRREMRGDTGPVEVDVVTLPPLDLPPPPPDGLADSEAAADPDEKSDDKADPTTDEAKKPDDPRKPKEKAEPKAPDPKPPEPGAVPPPEPKKPEPEPTPATPVPVKPPEPPPQNDGRIAVAQTVPKDQEDNPEAQRIADDANNVLEETMARLRSFDQDHPDPTPGTNNRGPADQVGNDTTDKTANAEEKEGDKTKAPGEAARASSAPTHQAPTPATPPNADRPTASGPTGAPGTAGSPDQARGASKADPGSPGGAGVPSPEVVGSDRGTYTLDPANPGGDGRALDPGKARKPSPYSARVDVRALGLGGSGLPGGPRMNLTQDLVERSIGTEKLAAERASAGAALRSKRTGRLDTNKFERWRPAIENYDPSVKLGNQTSLNAARKVFAGYLNHIHNRIHPVFAEEFLDSLGRVARSDVTNDPDLVTHVEIVLRKEDGAIVRMGITRNSGSTVFDASALESIDRAGPYGKAPDAIASPDGNIYLHWEFHRDPHDACSSRNARPYLLASAPPTSPTPRKPRPLPTRGEGSVGGPLIPLRTPGHPR